MTNPANGESEQLRARIAALEKELALARADGEVAAKDARYWRHLVESLPEFVSIFDRAGRFIYNNRIGPEYQAQEYIGHSLGEVVAPHYWQPAFKTAIETGQFTQYESYDENRHHWFRCSVGPLVLEDGETHLVVVSHNIDEEKRVEEELRNARELWDSLVSNSPDNILLLEPDSTVLFISKTAPGYTREDVVGQLATSFVEPQYRAPLLEMIQTASRTGKPQFFEMRDVRDRMWWLVTHVPVRDSRRGDLVLAISQDFTERRKTEIALAESEARLRLLLTQVPAIVWTIDTQMKLLSADGAGLALLNVNESDWKGKTLPEFYQTDEPTFPPLAAHRTALLGHSVTYEQIFSEHYLHIRVDPLRDGSGEVVGAVGVGIDVTARKVNEEELRRAKDELELRVAERTAQLDKVNQHLRDDIAQRERIERELRDSDERFRVIADTVPVAIVITRLADGLVVYVNQRLAEMFGDDASHLLNHKSTEFYVEPAQREQLTQRLQETSTVLDLELWLQSPAGKRMLVSGNYQLMNFDGQACVLTAFVDMTKRVETEQALLAERRFLNRLLELHDRDRQLISYELHDGIVQDMTAALMFLEATRPLEDLENAPPDDAFARGLQLLRGSIDEARRLINGLRPPVLEDEGVVAAITALVNEIERDAGIEVEVVVDVKFRRLAPALEMAIYRIVQEGLNNVWHHSRSPKARIELVQHDDTVTIRIVDWGIGFDPTKVSKRRYGLMGMRERARLLNGRAVVASYPGHGTTLQIELPLSDALMPPAGSPEEPGQP